MNHYTESRICIVVFSFFLKAFTSALEKIWEQLVIISPKRKCAYNRKYMRVEFSPNAEILRTHKTIYYKTNSLVLQSPAF